MPVTLLALPEKLPAASRLTMVLGVGEEVAALAALAPRATLAAVTPPTLTTEVADCVPVTSPLSAPVKFAAEPLTLPVTLPFRFPLMVPTVKLPLASRFTIVLG